MSPLEDIFAAVDIAASPQRVWTVLTGEGLVEEWLGCLNYRAEVGVLFHMQPDPARRAAGDVTGATHCELTALEPPGRMAFTWFMPGTPKTHVEIIVTPTPAGARVSLRHSGWDQFDAAQIRAIRDALAGGWTSAVLPSLKRLSEG